MTHQVAVGSARTDPLELLTPKDVCRLLKVSRRRLYNLEKSGKLRSVRLGSSIRFPRTEVERFLEDAATMASPSIPPNRR